MYGRIMIFSKSIKMNFNSLFRNMFLMGDGYNIDKFECVGRTRYEI